MSTTKHDLLSPNFTRSEFSCRCGCGYDAIDERLVQRLQVIRDIVRRPIIVTSACRCPTHNRNVGGSPNSLHLRGQACDWKLADDPDGTNLSLIADLLKDWSGGFKHYKEDSFIHCDIGPKRRW